MQPQIVTVLKTGGDFKPEHVERLRRQCEVHTPGVPFVCLTDSDLPYGTPLPHAWPGWWSKLNLLSLTGPILYLDLDTTIVGDLTPLLDATTRHNFIALRNPYDTPSRFGSGLMGWRGSMRHVYERFTQDPEHHMMRCKTPQLWGDQGFIAETETPSAYWQDLFPGQIVSWKVDCKQGVPADARIVFFHGQPRPWDVELKRAG